MSTGQDIHQATAARRSQPDGHSESALTERYIFVMGTTIGQGEFRLDLAEILRRVEIGESFTITRNGKPVADLIPHRPAATVRRRTLGELQATFRALPPIDVEKWRQDQADLDRYLRADEDR